MFTLSLIYDSKYSVEGISILDIDNRESKPSIWYLRNQTKAETETKAEAEAEKISEFLSILKGKQVIVFDFKDSLRALYFNKVSIEDLDQIKWVDLSNNFWNLNSEQPETSLQASCLKHNIKTKIEFDIYQEFGNSVDFEEVPFEFIQKHLINQVYSLRDLYLVFKEKTKSRPSKQEESDQLCNDILIPIMLFENNESYIDNKRLTQITIEYEYELQKKEEILKELLGDIDFNNNIVMTRFLESLKLNITAEKNEYGFYFISPKFLDELYETTNLEWVKILREYVYLRDFLIPRCFSLQKRKQDYIRFQYKTNQSKTGRFSYQPGKLNSYFGDINIHNFLKSKKGIVNVWPASESDRHYQKDIAGWMFSSCSASNEKFTSSYHKNVEGYHVKNNIRNIITTEGENLIVSFDSNAQELRVLANLANHQKWIDAFNLGVDIHEVNAKMLKEGIDRSVLDSDDFDVRGLAKEFAFGLLYGMQADSFIKKHTEIDFFVIERLYEKFLEENSVLIEYRDRLTKSSISRGFAFSGFGRQRCLSEYLKFHGKAGVSQAERICLNTLVQGIASDILRIQIKNLWELQKRKTEDVLFSPLFFIHDEIVCSIPRNYLKTTIREILNTLEYIREGWKVPIISSFRIGETWGNTFPFHFMNDMLEPVFV